MSRRSRIVFRRRQLILLALCGILIELPFICGVLDARWAFEFIFDSLIGTLVWEVLGIILLYKVAFERPKKGGMNEGGQNGRMGHRASRRWRCGRAYREHGRSGSSEAQAGEGNGGVRRFRSGLGRLGVSLLALLVAAVGCFFLVFARRGFRPGSLSIEPD